MRPGLGILVGLPVASVIALLCIIGIVLLLRWGDWDAKFFLWIVSLILLADIGVTAVAFWPYQRQYHYWQPVTGTVVAISNRFLPADGGSVEQKFVVQLKDHPQLYGIQDTRAALLKPGDTVDLSCIRVWQFGSGDHGYDCRWGAYR